MQNLWDFFENLNEIVYVSDVYTHELIYMNRQARKAYNFISNKEFSKGKCYEIIYRGTSPCVMCTNPKLSSNNFYEWKYYNPILNKNFLLKETLLEKDGRCYHITLAIDVTLQEKQERTIEEFQNTEALVNDALRYSLAANSPEKSLEVLLQHLGTSLHGDRIYIFEETPQQDYSNTYEWCAHNVKPQKDLLQHVPYDVVKLWMETFSRNQTVIIPDVEQIRESDPLVYSYLVPQNIHSIIVCALRFHDRIIGFYGIDNPPAAYLKHISSMFEVLGHFITSILRRRNLVKKLEKMSYHDQLTGALNRHAMNEYFIHVNPEESIGLIYCDVMGLKKVNDTSGHLEGDNLLLHTYQCLQSIFPQNCIFRIGGDEFLILQANISEETQTEQINKLRNDMSAYSVSLAIGQIWRATCSGQITSLLKEADSLMYEDKRNYYEKNGNDRRK